MTDPTVLRQDIGSVIDQDREATDDSLKTERNRADGLIEVTLEEETGERLERSREETGRRLSDGADDTAAPPVADLPEVAESLVEAAETLAEAAEGLSRVAQKLSEGHDSPQEGQPVVATNLSEVADSLEVMAATLADERRHTDDAMREERALIDETLQDERRAVDEAIEDERDAWRQLLTAERQATDRDLERERADTDRAVEDTIGLLKHEQDAHRRARDVVVTRDEFLAIVSHDLRTPLNTIALSAALLAEQVPRDERGPRASRWVEDIRRAASLMGRMLSDLLDATRFEEGRFRVALQHEDAVDVVRECAAAFDALARVNGLVLHVDVPDAAVPALFDRDRIVQVLSNLIRNAVQFTNAGGTITVRVEAEGTGCRITVRDTGAGIAAADLDRIFDRFQQAEKADRAGLGLGLYISKAIVEAHSGCIGVASEPGRGSTFSFTLPG